jgi:hypothetical protein
MYGKTIFLALINFLLYLEELSQKYFTREQIKSRMLKRAAELWGFSESEMDDFDPLVSMLIEACAVELERFAGDIASSRERITGRLAQLLNPGALSVSPAYGVVQMRSTEPWSIIYPDTQLVYTAVGPDRNTRRNGELYFSPALPVKIVDGAIRYIASGRLLSEVNDTGTTQLATAVLAPPEFNHSTWLGIELNDNVTTLDGISFFFNWVNQAGSEQWYHYLPYARCYMGEYLLNSSSGLQGLKTVSGLEEAFDPLREIESSVISVFSRHYITLKDGVNLPRRPSPPAFERIFSAKDLQRLKQPLVWIDIRWPTTLPVEALRTVTCSINAVPVLNRRLNRLTYRMSQTLNIVPLEAEENFFAMRRIINSQGQLVRLIPSTDEATLAPETYTIRQGIHRFNERDAYELLIGMADVVREESAFFSSMGEDFLNRSIRELNQVLARLREAIKTQQQRYAPFPFLLIRTGTKGTNTSIEFWTSAGLQANKLPIGSELKAYRNNDIQAGSVRLITSTYGGRDALNDAERIAHYRSALQTHDRIVTLEDLRVYLLAELEPFVTSVECKKDFIKSRIPGEGFVQCICILIYPQPGTLDEIEWESRLHQLLGKLSSRGGNYIPYSIKLATV